MPIFSTSDGCSLYYRFDGEPDKPTLVLSAPLGFTHAIWDAQVSALDKDFRILRYDLRGHGQSEATPGPYTIERLSLDTKELIETLNCQPAAFCGLSIGGMIGQWLCINSPQTVSRVVLANTAAKLIRPDPLVARLPVVASKGMSAITDDVLPRSLTEVFRNNNPAETDRLQAMLEEMSPEGYIAGGEAVLGMDLRNEIMQTSVPVLVITGTADTATLPEWGEALAASIPGAKLVSLESAHLSNIEQADQFNQLIKSFLCD